MNKRIVSLLLAALMLLALAACGGTASDSQAAASASAEGAAPAGEAAAPEEAPAEEAAAPEEAAPAEEAGSAAEEAPAEEAPAEEAPAPGSYPVSLPISEEMITLDWYTGDIGYLWSMLDDINENITLQELEKRTNIHLNWTFADFDGSQTALMIASGDWADVIDNANQQYPGGIQAGVADGIFLELTDAIQEYMPNYWAYLNEDPDLLRNCTDVDGRINFIAKIYKDNSPIMWGPFIRADWARDLGYDPAEIDTYDEYHDVMLAMKNEHDMNGVLRLLGTGVNMYGGLTYGYGVNGDLWTKEGGYPFYAEDGTVKFATMEDGFRDYLKMMNQWYEEGLFTSDFVSITDRNMFDAGEATGQYGIFYANISHVTNLYGQATEEGFELMPLPEPTLEEGESLKFSGSAYNRFSDNNLAIMADTEYLEEICRFTDYLFSDEGATLMNFGIEGTSYDVVDGEIQLNMDWIENCPTMPRANNYNDVRTGMLGAGIYTCLLDYWGFYDNFFNDIQLSTQEIWASRTPATLADSWEMPYYITNYMSVEDTAEINHYLTDIGTYLEEMVPSFIMGQKDIDAEWDTFVEEQKNMSIQTVIDIYQKAYDAYWA